MCGTTKKQANGIAGAILDYIFPRKCHLCNEILPDETKFICPLCRARMPRTNYHRMSGNPMEQRFAGIFPFVSATGHYFYSSHSDLSILMQDLKYRSFRGLARELGRIVTSELITTPFMSGIEAIVPVPMHFLKKARRGYNQTEEIAAGINEISGIPVLQNLVAGRPHKSQTKLSRKQRHENTTGIFHVRDSEALENQRPLHILLLDDVCTTGATLTAAATALLTAAPTLRISLLTVGVTL